MQEIMGMQDLRKNSLNRSLNLLFLHISLNLLFLRTLCVLEWFVFFAIAPKFQDDWQCQKFREE
jgi:hypothetical protein